MIYEREINIMNNKNKGRNYIEDTFFNISYVDQVITNYIDSIRTRRGLDPNKVQSLYNLLDFISTKLLINSNIHRDYPDTFAITQEHICLLFGTKTLNKSHHAYELFYRFFKLKYKGCKTKNVSAANAYILVDEFRDVFHEYLENTINQKVPMRKYEYGSDINDYTLVSKYDDDYNQVESYEYTTRCKINTDIDIEDLNYSEIFTLRHIIRCSDSQGYVTIYYKRESDSGNRLYDFGLVSIQRLKKNLRKLLLKGLFDYDIDNCALTLLYQQYLISGGKRLEGVEYYLANKEEVRENIAEHLNRKVNDFDKSYKLVKGAFIALFFGANLESIKCKFLKDLKAQFAYEYIGEITKEDYSDIYHKAVGLRNLIIFDHDFKKISQDFKIIKSQFLDNKGKVDKKAMARNYRKLESKLLSVIRDFHKSKGNRINVLIHDGWISEQAIDVDELQNYISSETGYDVTITGEQIGGFVQTKTRHIA